MFTKITLSLLYLTCSTTAMVDINRYTDALLDDLRVILDNQYSDGVQIDPISTSFKGKWLGSFFKVTIDVETSDSRLKGLTSVRRYTDVLYSETPSSVTFNVQIIFDRFFADFDWVHLSASLGSVTGSAEVKFTGLKGGFQVTMHGRGDACNAVLDNLWINNVGDIAVSYKGLSMFNYVFGKISEGLIRNVKEDLGQKIQDQLTDSVLRFMDRVDVCVFLDMIN